jgi:hypothetical protein
MEILVCTSCCCQFTSRCGTSLTWPWDSAVAMEHWVLRQGEGRSRLMPKGTDRKEVCLKGFESKEHPFPQSFLTPSLTVHKGSNCQQRRRGMLEVVRGGGGGLRGMKRVFLGKTLKFQKSLVRHYRNCNGLTCLGCMWFGYGGGWVLRLRDWPLGGARAYGVVPSRIVSTALLLLLHNEIQISENLPFQILEKSF